MTIEAAFLQQVADNPWPATLGAMQVLKDRARERSESLRKLVALSPGPLVPATAIVVLGETGEELQLDLTDPNVRTFLDAAIARATDDVRRAYVKRKILPGATPSPSDAPFNPRLEDEADAVWNAMNFALLATRDGIAQAAAELKTRDDTHKFNPLFEVFLKEGIKEGVLEIVNQLLEGAGHGMKVFGMGWAGGHISTDLELIWEALRGVIAPGTTKEEMPTDSKIELFAQGEIRTQTSLQFRAHNQFLRRTKQEYRDAERDQPGFGLVLAKLDRAHWERQVGTAARTAHDKSLSKFAVVLAHEGVKGSSARDGTNVANTADMFHALGVLALEIEGYGPQHGFRVLSKRLRGIPAAARKHLERKTIRDVDIPIVARGPVFAQYKSFSPFQLILALGETHEGANLREPQRVRNLRWDAEPERERARVWLARKGDPAVKGRSGGHRANRRRRRQGRPQGASRRPREPPDRRRHPRLRNGGSGAFFGLISDGPSVDGRRLRGHILAPLCSSRPIYQRDSPSSARSGFAGCSRHLRCWSAPRRPARRSSSRSSAGPSLSGARAAATA